MTFYLKHFFFLLITFAIAVLPAPAQQQTSSQLQTELQQREIVAVANFGVKSNSFENAIIGIKKAIEYCKGRPNVLLLLPGGRIDLWPEGAYQKELYISNATESDTLSKVKNIAMLLDGFNNITIEGNNTLVVLHGKTVSFAVLNSANVTVKNVRFDYERPTMSEMTILSVSPNAIDAKVHPDSKYDIDSSGHLSWYGEGWKSKSFHAILFDPAKNTMEYSSFKPFLQSKAVETGPLQLRFEGDFSSTNYQPGHVLTIRDPYRDNAGALINLSKNIRLENIVMQYMHGMGIVSQFSEDLSFTKVKIAPAPGSGRIVAAFADCFHFSGCRGSILIDSCFTSGSHDDPVNVHSTHLKITSINDKKLTVRFMHHQTWGFEAFFAQDSIAFVNPATLLPLGYGVVKSARLVNKREMELKLSSGLPANVKVGDVIENLTWTPELTVRNSHFERTNTRGILVTTRRKVLIENNTFFRTGMHAILIANDAAGWYESGPVQDVTIRNNRFEECGYNSSSGDYVIAIAPENHDLVPGKYVHKNIRIENNFFKVFDTPLLTAKSVDGLIFSNNTIEQSDFMKSTGNKPAIKLTASKEVVVRNNVFNTKWKAIIRIANMSRKNIRTNLVITEVDTK